MTLATGIGIAAGVLHALGYYIYACQVISAECRPNGMTWLMWTYCTLVLFFIELDQGAPAAILFLPAVCALASIFVSVYAFLRASYIPPAPQDWAALGLDAAIMLGYLVVLYTPIDAGDLGMAPGAFFVLATGATSLTSSWPILRTTSLEPANERPLAWFLWSAAYGLMALAVMLEGMSWHYLIYPLLCQGIHFWIGCFALAGGETEAGEAAEHTAA